MSTNILIMCTSKENRACQNKTRLVQKQLCGPMQLNAVCDDNLRGSIPFHSRVPAPTLLPPLHPDPSHIHTPQPPNRSQFPSCFKTPTLHTELETTMHRLHSVTPRPPVSSRTRRHHHPAACFVLRAVNGLWA